MMVIAFSLEHLEPYEKGLIFEKLMEGYLTFWIVSWAVLSASKTMICFSRLDEGWEIVILLKFFSPYFHSV